jgi:hypothetical protein
VIRLLALVFVYQQQQQMLMMAHDRTPELWRFGLFGEIQPTVTAQRLLHSLSSPFISRSIAITEARILFMAVR